MGRWTDQQKQSDSSGSRWGQFLEENPDYNKLQKEKKPLLKTVGNVISGTGEVMHDMSRNIPNAVRNIIDTYKWTKDDKLLSDTIGKTGNNIIDTGVDVIGEGGRSAVNFAKTLTGVGPVEKVATGALQLFGKDNAMSPEENIDSMQRQAVVAEKFQQALGRGDEQAASRYAELLNNDQQGPKSSIKQGMGNIAGGAIENKASKFLKSAKGGVDTAVGYIARATGNSIASGAGAGDTAFNAAVAGLTGAFLPGADSAKTELGRRFLNGLIDAGSGVAYNVPQMAKAINDGDMVELKRIVREDVLRDVTSEVIFGQGVQTLQEPGIKAQQRFNDLPTVKNVPIKNEQAGALKFSDIIPISVKNTPTPRENLNFETDQLNFREDLRFRAQPEGKVAPEKDVINEGSPLAAMMNEYKYTPLTIIKESTGGQGSEHIANALNDMTSKIESLAGDKPLADKIRAAAEELKPQNASELRRMATYITNGTVTSTMPSSLDADDLTNRLSMTGEPDDLTDRIGMTGGNPDPYAYTGKTGQGNISSPVIGQVMSPSMGVPNYDPMATPLSRIIRPSNFQISNKQAPLNETRTQVQAFHGSPYQFQKFDSSKIGTGEGAQSFGHGLYFTDEKEIAKHYIPMNDIGNNKVKNLLEKENKIASTNNPEGNIYSVTLHKGKTPDQYDYLRWDEPFTESQNKKIVKQVEKDKPKEWEWLVKEFQKPSSENSSNDYQTLSNMFGSDKAASDFLLKAGIDGIKYPAGTLSGSESDAFNYVVFDPNAVSIDKINDKPLETYTGAGSGTMTWSNTPEGTRVLADENAKNIYWHGSISGDLRGGATGLHLGSKKAATQALEARIGVPAEGEWDGTKEYGKTLLMGKNKLRELESKGIYKNSGYNVDAPEEDYYPNKAMKYPDGNTIPMDTKPNIQPFKINGKMANSPNNPRDDTRANATMGSLLKRGKAKSGYFYDNVGEDNTYPSVVVPNGDFVKPITQPLETYTGAGSGTMTSTVQLQNMTTNILEDLKGKENVSKQYISDLTNQGKLKQIERDIARSILAEMPEGKINVQEFSDKMRSELLPLKTRDTSLNTPERLPYDAGQRYPKYEGITLPTELRGKVGNYTERIYQSPIRTSAGDVHFRGDDEPNYFAHTRIEDMADKQTRRVIELQSDLFQKGKLIGEYNRILPASGMSSNDLLYIKNEASKDYTPRSRIKKYKKERMKLERLEPYRNNWWQRITKEEIKKASEDKKPRLQFPTGETAMKIEGLGENGRWRMDMPYEYQTNQKIISPEDLEVGLEVYDDNYDRWIVAKVLDDGKFMAFPENKVVDIASKEGMEPQDVINDIELRNTSSVGNDYIETFDISGTVDRNNPIYKFYEKDVQKYLKKIHPEMERVTDDQGVEWFEIQPTDEAKEPIGVFGDIKQPNGTFTNSSYTGSQTGTMTSTAPKQPLTFQDLVKKPTTKPVTKSKSLAEIIKSDTFDDRFKSFVEQDRKVKLDVEPKTKTRGLAKGVEEKAIANDVVKSLGELPEYRTRNMEEELTKAQMLVEKDYETAKRIAMGEDFDTKGLIPELVFKAVEDKALVDGDVELLRELGTKSGLLEEATYMGQRIRALAERDPYSPVLKMQDITNTRKKAIERVYGSADEAVKQTTNEIQQEIAKTAPQIKDWSTFIDSIKCA